MFSYLQLQTDSRTEVVREADPSDRWDRDDTSTDWTIRGIKLLTSDDYQTVCVPFEAKVGDRVYPVWAIWSTGDSFGNDAGAHLELIDVFQTEAKAKACVEALTSGGKDKYTAQYKRENDTSIKFHRPWVGYFEGLDDLTYEGMVVE